MAYEQTREYIYQLSLCVSLSDLHSMVSWWLVNVLLAIDLNRWIQWCWTTSISVPLLLLGIMRHMDTMAVACRYSVVIWSEGSLWSWSSCCWHSLVMKSYWASELKAGCCRVRSQDSWSAIARYTEMVEGEENEEENWILILIDCNLIHSVSVRISPVSHWILKTVNSSWVNDVSQNCWAALECRVVQNPSRRRYYHVELYPDRSFLLWNE